MTNPYLRNTALLFAVIGVSLTGALAQGVALNLGDDDGFTEEAVQPNVGDDSGDTAIVSRTFARANYVWPYASGPNYQSQVEANLVPGTPGVITTPVGVFRVGSGMPSLPAELRVSMSASPAGGQYFYLLVSGGEEAALGLSNKISRDGGRVLSYDPNSQVMVAKVMGDTIGSLTASSGVVAYEPIHSALKLHPSIGRIPLADPVRATSEIYTLDVLLFPGEDVNLVAPSLSALGANVKTIVGARHFPKVTIEVHRSKLAQIAALEPVMLVLENTPWMLLAEETTTTMQTGGYNQGATPYHDAGINGGGGGGSYGFCSLSANVGCTTVGGDSCTLPQGTCDTETEQILTVVDNGIQLDSGDLSNERADAGWDIDHVVANHRKVLTYETTGQFAAGQGDLSGCDLPLNGGRTHGHIVAATAIGNGTNVDSSYNGPGWVATDLQEEFWALDGVAPGGRLVAYDAQVTPGSGSCDDPLLGLDVTFNPGQLYVNGGAANLGSLSEGYVSFGARSFNLSFGKAENTYGDDAIQVDEFLFDFRDAMVYVAAGNQGTDASPPGGDGEADPLELQTPATAKNALAIGASRNADRVDAPESRAFFSGTGPAVNDTSVNRMAPHLMAPGDEANGGTLGMSSEFACRSSDNNQDDPVECDITAANEGTSFSAPAAAGSGMLVRDYFARGFYPAGVQDITEAVPTVSGNLVKGALIASADFMTGVNLALAYRHNFEQGYGRIQLDNVLPLETWARAPSGLVVEDVLNGSVVINDIGGGITGRMNTSGAAQSGTFKVCNDKEDLRVALTWTDPVDTGLPPTGRLVNNLNLKLTAPSGIVYRGNYYTDDNNRDESINPDGGGEDEDCPAIGGIGFNVQIDEGQWALPICSNSKVPGTGATTPALNDFDAANTMEAIFLSPNADGFWEDTTGDGVIDSPTYVSGTCTAGSGSAAGLPCGNHRDCTGDNGYQACNAETGAGDCCQGGDLQTEPGIWTIEVSRGNTLSVATDYSIVIAGGVCAGSSVLVDQASYSCNGEVEIVVSEDTDGLSSTDIEQRTIVQVLDDQGVVVDEEDLSSLIPLDFIQDTANRFASATVKLSAGTSPDPGNGVLDVKDGDTIRVVYTDVEAGVQRKASASVNCQVDLTLNAVLNAQYGQDQSVVFFGGCERNVRNKFELAGVGGFGGFPDRYLDADEFIQVDFIFQSDELLQLDSVDVSLSCVEVDADSPAACLPDGTNCTPANCGGPCDPRRDNNPSCDGTIDDGTQQTAGTPYMSIVDPTKNVGILPGLSTLGTRFSIEMGADDVGGDPFFGQPTPIVELLIRVADPTSGKQASGVGVNRIKLNVDAIETFYSTDFPMGGTAVEVIDRNQNEVPEDPIYEPGPGFQGLDYRFETRSFGNMLVGKDAQGNTINRNQNLKAPWNFDGNDGSFVSGLGAATDESLVTTGIYNWGEDENFNNVEDGVCGGDRSIRCFKIGSAGSDPRCANVPGFPAARACLSIEDRAGDGSGLANFNSNWSTKGGCGWQTRAPQTCDQITTRGCFTNDDCQGSCINDNNPIVSTFEGCFNDGQCSLVWQCSTSSDDQLIFSPCGTCSVSGTPCLDQDDSDCPAGETCNADNGKCGVGTCTSGNQICDGEAGLCTGGQGGGGVWHTGVINTPTAVNFDDPGCFGSEPTNDCQIYRTISGTGDGLVWYNFLLTPVMEKVNQEEDSVTGDAVAQIEIWNWAWNHSIDLPDNFVLHTWEMDTDVSKILPVDLTSDVVVLNSGNGQWGPITRGNNPNLEDGWGLFAPMGTCGVKNCGGLGTPSTGTRCEVVEDCNDGGCSKGLCDKGGCRLCDPPSACVGVTCANDDDCINAPGQTGGGATCDSPPPNTETCANTAECDADLGGPGAACIGVGTSCFNDAFCQDEFGQDSACTNPSPQGCLPVAAGNTESPCQIDSQCGQGECLFGGTACSFDSECDAVIPGDLCGDGTSAARAELCATSAVSVNGQVGNDRDGQNSCFFQGSGLITEIGRTELGIVEPIDNDLDDDLTTLICAGDATKTCETTADCQFKGTTGPCQFGVADGVDEYVTLAGPKRNFDLIDQPWNGPDMRFFTLEDIYGDTGNTFQGALGFVTFQGSVGFPAKGGFGEAIDDMVVEWREFTLEPDATDCDAGSCATVIIDTDRAFTGEKVVNYRLMDQSPYGFYCDATGDVCYPADTIGRAPCVGDCIAGQNDCNYNTKFNDAGDDDDCDNNGTPDVIVLLKSEAEPLGENTIANQIGPGVYQGSIVTSSLGNSDGVLFLAQIGADNPTVTALYADNNDGTGNICENSIVPEQQGFVQDGSVVLFDNVCNVLVTGFSFSDNGDSDDFADTNETGTVTLDLLNNCGFALTNCLMRFTSNNDEIDCIFNPVVPLSNLPCSGDAPCTLPPGQSVQAPPFQFRVASDVQGSDPNNPPVVNFALTMTCDQIDGLDQPQSFSMSLDLDIVFNPADITDYNEGFEGSAGSALADGGTTWEAQNNDFGIPGSNDSDGLVNGDGYRCQYSDPDWPNAGSSGNSVETNCFPGTRNNADLPWWQIDGQNITDNQVDIGRAKSGTRSMYYGKYDEVPSNPDATDPFVFTTLAAVIEGAGTIDPVNLGVDPSPVLSWWQQISLIDGRTLTINTTRSADRGVVQLQVAANDGSPIGDWIKLVPFQNAYDTQAYSNYFNCMFDPVDDGNTEDDFFDPTDPGRRLGPSSTCFGSVPGGTTDFTWSCIGNTDSPFATTEVCNGTTPPLNSDRPSWPPNTIDSTGTWLESKIDLSAYKGRRVRLRYIVSSLKASSDTWEEQFTYNPTERDDGWWVDDINLNSALINPALITVDTKANGTLPICGAACTSLSAIVTVVSEQPSCDAGGNGSALGEPCGSDANCVAITAGSTCVRVINPTTVVLDAPGQVIELNALGFDNTSEADSCQSGTLQFQFLKNAAIVRQWTEDSVYVDAPLATSTYGVQVRCSTLTSCTDTHNLTAQVECPATGNLRRFPDVSSDAPGSFSWQTDAGEFQVYEGPLGSLPTFAGSVTATGQVGTSWVDSTVPTADTFYMFARGGSTVGLGCNALPFAWTSGGSAEVDGAGTLGTCNAGGDGSAEGMSCHFNADCQDIAGDEASCVFSTNRDDNATLPAP